MGVAKKQTAQNYWDNKTTELDIPEIDGDFAAVPGEVEEVFVSAPAAQETAMVSLNELQKEHAQNVPSVTNEGIDISLLTQHIRPIKDLIETDMHWDYINLQAEIGQNFREKYAAGDLKIEGFRANNI